MPAIQPKPLKPIAASFARPFSAAGLAVAMLLLATCAQAQDERADASVDATDPANPKDPLPLWEVGLVGIAAVALWRLVRLAVAAGRSQAEPATPPHPAGEGA